MTFYDGGVVRKLGWTKVGHGRRSVGDGGGDASTPTFQLGGDHIGNAPPLVCLKREKYHVFGSPSNLHSFVSLHNLHRLCINCVGTPPPSPNRSTRVHKCMMNHPQ